jgi:hypothetical protein
MSNHKKVETTPRSQLERAALRDRDLDRGVTVDWYEVDREELQEPDIEPEG